MALHIVLVEPEIPPNTGNIARSCAITGCELHLVKPLGFSIDDKSLKRAGLDYWPYVTVHVHDDLDSFMKENEGRRMFFATTKGSRSYAEVEYEDGDMILFGRETKGLPTELIRANGDMTIRIPMSSDTRLRSLNLSNSAAIIMYEAMRQLGFPGLE